MDIVLSLLFMAIGLYSIIQSKRAKNYPKLSQEQIDELPTNARMGYLRHIAVVRVAFLPLVFGIFGVILGAIFFINELVSALR